MQGGEQRFYFCSDRIHYPARLRAERAVFGSARPGAPQRDQREGGSPAKLVTASRLSMGSTLAITAWTADESAAKPAFDEVFAEFTRLDKLMSTWIPDSDVSRVNREAGVRPVPVSAEVREVLKTARQMSEWTGGKFDVTFGALSGLWKFDHDQDNVIPDMREVRRRLPLIDYRAIHIDDAAGTVFLARKGMSMHLGGIGKGYAVDRGAAFCDNEAFVTS